MKQRGGKRHRLHKRGKDCLKIIWASVNVEKGKGKSLKMSPKVILALKCEANLHQKFPLDFGTEKTLVLRNKTNKPSQSERRDPPLLKNFPSALRFHSTNP
jgi:hypothetical protein